MKIMCKWFGHKWHDSFNPICLRCGHELADDVANSGGIHMGWGRYGWIEKQDDPNPRDRADVYSELERINSLPSWRP